jgi:hypothetical protein
MNPPLQLTDLKIGYRRSYPHVEMIVFINQIRSVLPLKNLSINLSIQSGGENGELYTLNSLH